MSGRSSVFISNYVCVNRTFVLVPNVWLRPPGATQRREADAAKALLTVPEGDHLTLLNVYNQYNLSGYPPKTSRRSPISDVYHH
jgi:hypothetical protein